MGPRPTLIGSVEDVERLTPHMIRVVLGGQGLASFTPDDFSDSYVKLLFPPAGAPYTTPFDLAEVQDQYPKLQWPAKRTYTVRAWDPSSLRLTIDFVYHGDKGLAGPWAANARPGDLIQLLGPGGAYLPDPDADWHLMVGDDAALPAIAASLERMPAGATARVFLEVEGPEDEQPLPTDAAAEIVWVHRSAPESQPGETLVELVRNTEFPDGDAHAFVHGDAGFVKDLRRHLRFERGISRDRMSVSGYWRRGRDEEGWRAVKAEWKAAIDAEEQAAAQT